MNTGLCPVVRNPSAKAGDTGSIPGLGRFHMPWGTLMPSPCPTTREATAMRSPLAATRETLCTAAKTQCRQK